MPHDSDPLLRSVRALEGPELDAATRARIGRRAEAALRGGNGTATWRVALACVRLGVPAVLVVCEGIYVVKAVALMARVFG